MLRIEDTDLERSTEESVNAILEGMTWLGLEYEEGPFYQTHRFDHYNQAIDALMEKGLAYRCNCSRERLDSLRRANGAYGWSPDSATSLRNTAHCVLALAQLGQAPRGDRGRATANYVRTCQSREGGFGHRPGFSPTVVSTWYAARVLEAIGVARAPDP